MSSADAVIDAPEVQTVAGKMARAYGERVGFYRDEMHLTATEGDAKARDPDCLEWQEERILHGPPDQVSWFAFAQVAEVKPEVALAAWESMKQYAREELATGHRAADALDPRSAPWGRAQFLAIRSALREEWQPTGGIEDVLIDTMAQAYCAYLEWLARLQVQATTEGRAEDDKLKRDGYWQPPRIDIAAWMDQAAAMVDRFNRILLKTLRGLRDLRRYSPSIVIASAGQVNIGEQQVNVASSGAVGETQPSPARGQARRPRLRKPVRGAATARPEDSDGDDG